MNRGELIKEVAKVVCSAKEARLAVDEVLNTIVKTLKEGQAVTLVGFGTFRVVKRAAREGRNPQTGAPIKIKASGTPKFSAGKTFRNAIR